MRAKTMPMWTAGMMAACLMVGGTTVRADNASAQVAVGAPTVPSAVKSRDGVKGYLLQMLVKMRAAAADLKTVAQQYDALVTAAGSPTAAAAAHPQQVADLINKMRHDYQQIDSFGYEYIEGIVAGVPSLMKYDIELDSGVPAKKSELQDNIANIVIHAGDLTIDHEGSLNNFLIEPTVYGTNARFTQGTATLPGFDKPVNLPRPKLVLALADYAIDGYARLDHDAHAWHPSDRDFFEVLANMTPTLADYFEEWKESKKYGSASGGRFVAVSRVSDMRGIMSSVRLTWLGIADKVHVKDPALADKITLGYDQIIHFIDKVDAREARRPLTIQLIDALGSQAKERADGLTVQANQAAAILGIDVTSK